MPVYKDNHCNRIAGRVGKEFGKKKKVKKDKPALHKAADARGKAPAKPNRKPALPPKSDKVKRIGKALSRGPAPTPIKIDKSRMMSVKLGLKDAVSKKWAKANPDYLEKHKKLITRGEKAPMGFKGEYEIHGHRDRKNWKDRGSHWSITGTDPRDSMFDDEHQRDPEFMKRIGGLRRKKDGTPMGIEKMMKGYKKEIGGWDNRKLI